MADQPTTRWVAPGWHPDPHDHTQYRWWDGKQWTGATYSRQPRPKRGVGRTVGAIVLSIFAVVAAMAFIGQFSETARESGQSFNVIPGLMAVGWSWCAFRCWNPKR